MCGIAGIVAAGDTRSDIEEMTDCMRHRGPDDRGVWTSDGVALGHRRLSILDLSKAGHQPMTFGDYTIVHNGEIYNFRELRRELEGPFRSTSDTEVLLHLYARDGARCVDRLEGMFAFAIWDRRRQRLFAARDRLGIKPFLFRRLDGGLAFASELKALLKLGVPDVDRTALRDYFSYKYVPAPKTIYRGIEKLRPGHTLTWEHGRLKLDRYWRPEAGVRTSDEAEALAELEALLSKVVTAHLVSDVPVGVFLSGGIDSTTVVANLRRPLTFTLGFDAGGRDETQAAREIADHFGAEHRSEVASGGFDLDQALEMMPRIYDEPFGDHGAWPVFMVSRLARKEVKVALSGEGGDELFAGYHWYDKWPRTGFRGLHRLLAFLSPTLSIAGRAAERRAATGLERYAMFLGPFTPRQKRALLDPGLLDGDYDDLWYFREFWREDLDPIKRLQWADLHTYLPDDMMTKLDRASMAVSLEARPPLLDHRLVEWALGLDSRLMHDGRQGKVLVRRYLEKRVPRATLTRPKIGFSMPVRRWVKRRPELLGAALARLRRAGVLRSVKRPSFNSEQAWSLLVLDRWLQEARVSL